MEIWHLGGDMKGKSVEVNNADKSRKLRVPEDDVVLERRRFSRQGRRNFKNKALAHFDDYNFKNVEVPYDFETMTYLVHLQNRSPCLRYVFTPGSSQLITNQLFYIHKLSNRLDCPVFFIFPAHPDSDALIFLVGVIYQTHVLIINPQGENLSEDMSNLFTNLFKPSDDGVNAFRFYLCSNQLINDVENTFSIGPLCVEIFKALAVRPQTLLSDMEVWSKFPVNHLKSCFDLKYYPVSLPSLESLSEFSQKISEIRARHYLGLQEWPLKVLMETRPNEYASIENQNMVIECYATNAPEQVLLKELVNEEFPAEALHEHESVKSLKILFETKLDHNHAVKGFLDKKLNSYHETYNLGALTYLAHMEQFTTCIKYVFTSGVYESFIKQLWHLNTLASQFDCPAIFISPEPSTSENSNYVVGVLYRNQLLFINPQGDVLKESEKMTKILMLLSHKDSDYHFINRVYISTNIIQCDTDKECSRGPICVEILFALTKIIQDIKRSFDAWSHIQDEKNCYTLKYFSVDISSFFSDELRNLELPRVVQQLEGVRNKHASYLEHEFPQDIIGLEAQNHYLSEIVLKAPEQLLINSLTQMEISWMSPELRKLREKLGKRLLTPANFSVINKDDREKTEPKLIQMCQSILVVSNYIKLLIKWFDEELLQYFHAFYSVKSYAFKHELHPDTAYTEEEKKSRCEDLFDILSSERLALNTKYTYTPALKEFYDFSDVSERRLFLKTKIHLTKSNRDFIRFGALEDAIELGEILNKDDSEILTHLTGYSEPGIEYPLLCGQKSGLEEFIQSIVLVVEFSSVDADFKFEGIVRAVNLARHLISILNDIRFMIRRGCFFISKTLQTFALPKEYGEPSQLFSVVKNVNEMLNDVDTWCRENENYRDLRGLFMQHTVPTLSHNTRSSLEKIYPAFALKSPLNDFLNDWLAFQDAFIKQHKLKENIFSSKRIGLHKLKKGDDPNKLCPLNKIDTTRLRILAIIESARSTLTTIIKNLHDALFAVPDINYRTAINLLRWNIEVVCSDHYDERLRKERETENPPAQQAAVSSHSPRTVRNQPVPSSPRRVAASSPVRLSESPQSLVGRINTMIDTNNKGANLDSTFGGK